MRTLLTAFAALVILLLAAPTPSEARCVVSYQKDHRGHSCGARSSTQKRYAKLGRKHYQRRR